MPRQFKLTVNDDSSGSRLDSYISDELDSLSRNRAQKLIEEEHVSINDKVETSKKYNIKSGEIIKVVVPDPEEVNIEPEDIELDMVYEDKDILIVDKPQGLVVHPAPGNYSGTLVNALMHHFGDDLSGINGELRPGIVHRIDKDTSGLLVVAKNDEAHSALSAQLADHKINRVYEAIVHNNFIEDEGTIDLPIGRDPKNRLKQAVNDKGRYAVTHYRVLDRFGDLTHIELKLKTGRTHQIRVHMAYKKHPLLGDELYGPGKKYKGDKGKGQYLHAGLLGFLHPRSGEYIEFKSEPPESFKKMLSKLKNRLK